MKLIWILTLTIILMFIFFPKSLYRLIRFYFKYFLITLPITIGFALGIISFNFLATCRSFEFMRGYELLIKPIFVVVCAVAVLKLTFGLITKL